MSHVLRASFLAAVAATAGFGVARSSPDGPANLQIAGVVRDEQGRPIPAARIEVEGYPNTLKSPPPWTTDVHGLFQTDDVPRGSVKLLVTIGWGSAARTKVVQTRAGARDLAVVLDPGPQLFLRIVDFVPGQQLPWARVTWEEPAVEGERRYVEERRAPIRDDGWIRFVALPADREFAFWAQVERHRHVRARGLKPGETEHRIERSEVKDIAGKVRGPESLLEFRVDNAVGPLREHLRVDVFAPPPWGGLGGRDVASVRVESDGSFRVRGLPPGTYRLSMDLFDGILGGVSKQVEAGTTDVVIDLDREPAREPPVADPKSPKTWVHESRTSPVYWWIWAQVRDYLGEEEWKSIDCLLDACACAGRARDGGHVAEVGLGLCRPIPVRGSVATRPEA
jgi:hypothetical protein